MPSPTPRQQEILVFLAQEIGGGMGAPTLGELSQHFGIHVNAARKHLIALEKKGHLELVPGRSRGIRLTTSSVLSKRAREDRFELPLVGRVAAGSPLMSEGNIEARYTLDPALFRPRPDFLLRVEGHSMVGVGIEHGDLIAVHRTPVADPGRIVVARLDGEITVKRLQRDGDGWQLLSANPAFAPIRIDPHGTDFAIEGLYVGAIKRA
jgi:repressor LexA